MIFTVNSSPLSGKEQLSQLRATCATPAKRAAHQRLHRVEDTDTPESFRVLGRGELQLAILIETCAAKALN